MRRDTPIDPRPPTAAEIAAFLNLPLHGLDAPVLRPADLADSGPGDLVWVRGEDPVRVGLLSQRRPALAICLPHVAAAAPVPALASPRPRLDFIRALNRFFAPQEAPVRGVHPAAFVDPLARLGREVSVGPCARIGPRVQIGDGSVIGAGVHIEGQVQLGAGCVIKPNAVLGGQGYTFEYDEDGAPLHFPHIGRLVLGDGVWVGACSTIELAGLGVTHIGRGVKIDDLVQVGHNVTVGENTLLMAQVVLCGGAKIGARCWIAPGSLVKQKVRIGDDVTVGLGAVVLRDVPDGQTVAGVPARALERKS